MSETLMTEYSENLDIVESKNGQKSYRFVTPLMEGYKLAREPYREFRRGVKITTYKSSDSLTNPETTLTSDYAIYYENRQLWEAKGNVVVVQDQGRQVFTQQLFWNQLTHRIYSNVDTKIIEPDSPGYTIVEGFESDDSLKDWRGRRYKGRMYLDVEPARRDTASNSGAISDLRPTPLDEEIRAGRLSADAQQRQPAHEERQESARRDAAEPRSAGGTDGKVGMDPRSIVGSGGRIGSSSGLGGGKGGTTLRTAPKISFGNRVQDPKEDDGSESGRGSRNGTETQ